MNNSCFFCNTEVRIKSCFLPVHGGSDKARSGITVILCHVGCSDQRWDLAFQISDKWTGSRPLVVLHHLNSTWHLIGIKATSLLLWLLWMQLRRLRWARRITGTRWIAHTHVIIAATRLLLLEWRHGSRNT